MLYREIMAVCSEIHTNTLCGQNVELLNVKPAVPIVTPGPATPFSTYTPRLSAVPTSATSVQLSLPKDPQFCPHIL